MICLGPPPNSAQRMGIPGMKVPWDTAVGRGRKCRDAGWESVGFGLPVPWVCSPGSLRLTGLPFPLLQFRAIPFILKSLELVPTGSIDGAISNSHWLQNQSLFHWDG